MLRFIWLALVSGAASLETPLKSYNFSWTLEDSKLKLTLDVATTGWIGFALSSGSGMRGSDFVRVDGEGNVEDGYGLHAQSPPLKDCQQDWSLESRVVEQGHTQVVISRAFDTLDDQDHALKNDGLGTFILVAHSRMDTKPFQYHFDHRATMHIDFFNPQKSMISTVDALYADPAVKQVKILMHQPGAAADVPYTVPMPGNLDTVTNMIDSCVDLPEEVLENGAHLVAFEAQVTKGNTGLMHHYVLLGSPYSCAERRCDVCDGTRTFGTMPTLWAWQVGIHVYPLPADLGFSVGKGTRIKAVLLNAHYDNPTKEVGLQDNSGAILHYTLTKRKYDLGSLLVGDGVLALQGEPVIVSSGSGEKTKALHSFECPASFLKPLAGKIKLVGSLQHMHRAGDFMQTKLVDWMGKEKAVWKTELYDGNFQSRIDFNQTLEIEAGDELQVSCVYDNALKSRRKEELVWGTQGDDEMCMDFINFYSEDSEMVQTLNNQPNGCSYGYTPGTSHLSKPIQDTQEEMGVRFGRPPRGKDRQCKNITVDPSTEQPSYRMYQVGSSSLSVGQLGLDNASETVVALHGFPEASGMWFQSFAPAMLKKFGSSMRVVAPDMRGVNRSMPKYACGDLGCANYTPEVITDEVASLLKDHFAAEAKPVHLCGHDWGALIAWRIAILYPELVKTLSVANVAHPSVFRQFLLHDQAQLSASDYTIEFAQANAYDTIKPAADKAHHGLVSGVLAEVPDMAYEYMQAWLYKDSLKYGLYWYRGSYYHFANAAQGINNSNMVVKMPVLQMWGADDTAVHSTQVCCLKHVAEKLHVKVLEGVGHFLIDTNGADFANQMAGLIRNELSLDRCSAVAPHCSKAVQAVCEAMSPAPPPPDSTTDCRDASIPEVAAMAESRGYGKGRNCAAGKLAGVCTADKAFADKYCNATCGVCNSTQMTLHPTDCDVSGYIAVIDKFAGTAASPSCDVCGGQTVNRDKMYTDQKTPCSFVFDNCQASSDQCQWSAYPCSDVQYGLMASDCCGEKAVPSPRPSPKPSPKPGAEASCGATWGDYILALSGATSCAGCGSTILDYAACKTAAATGTGALGINDLGQAENWGGPSGCHIQDGGNFQWNDNPNEGKEDGHTPVCKVITTTTKTTTTRMTTTPSTKHETTQKVRTVVTLQSLDFDKVNSNAAVKTKLIGNIKTSFLEQLPPGYTEQHLAVTLSKGSVKAQVDITPISAASSQTLRVALAATTPAIEGHLLEKVQAMPEVDSMLESGKKKSELTVAVAAPTELETGISASSSWRMSAAFSPVLSLLALAVV